VADLSAIHRDAQPGFAGHYGRVPASPGGPKPRSSNHRGKEWLREAFRIDPPRGPREALRWFVVSLAVVMPLGIGTSLLFEVLGWPTKYGVAIGLGLGFPIADWYLHRRY
jgi:hypothetical protein